VSREEVAELELLESFDGELLFDDMPGNEQGHLLFGGLFAWCPLLPLCWVVDVDVDAIWPLEEDEEQCAHSSNTSLLCASDKIGVECAADTDERISGRRSSTEEHRTK
jgi:hypothetical protein